MQGMNSLTNLNFLQFNYGQNPAYYNCPTDLNFTLDFQGTPLHCITCDQHETSLRDVRAQNEALLAEN